MVKTEATLTEWTRLFNQGRVVPPCRHTSLLCGEKQGGESCGLELSLSRVTAPHVPQGAPEGPDVAYELRASLYDSLQQQFFGQTWKSCPQRLKNGKICFNQVLYFHTALRIPGVLLVLELVELTVRADSSHQTRADSSHHTRGRGFTLLQLFGSTAPPEGKQRLNLHDGSPRSLLHPSLKDPIHYSGLLKALDGAHVDCTVRTHSALASVLHLVPENVLLCGDEVMPGLENPPSGGALLKPRALPTLPCSLSGVSVSLKPSMESFERHLLQRLNTDCQHTKQPGAEELARPVVIQERRLHVGVHNGWGFLERPQVLVLPPTGSKNKDGVASLELGLRSSLQLSLPPHPAVVIVFMLEYVFSAPIGKETMLSATSSRRAAFLQCLRWGVWSPLQPPVSEGPEGEITVALRGGPEPNPHNVMVYTPHSQQQQQEVDTISFSFCSVQDRRAAHSRSERAQERSSQPRRTSTSRSPAHGRRALDSPPDSPPGQGLSLSQLAASSRYPSITHFGRASPWQPASLLHQSPLATAHQLPHVMSSMAHLEVDLDPGAALRPDEDHLQETAYTPVHAPVLHLGTSTSGPYLGSSQSRGALAQLSAAGFPPVLDCTGQPAHTLDPDDPLSFDPHREETDLLQGDLLLLQFLAFTRSPQSAGSPHWPRSVYLTFQLYRFQPVTTHPVVLLEPPQSGGPFCLLTTVTRDGPSSGPPGLQLQFRVDSSFLRPGERPWFLQYLASHSLQLDVWDSDSLLLVGSAAFPLKIMLRQGKPAVQALHELDVLTTEYVGEELLGTGGDQGPNCPLSVHTVLRGRLHVRTGNMGCPTPPDQQTPLATPPSHVVMPGEVSGGFRGGSVCARDFLQTSAGNSARAQRLQSELPIRADLARAQQSQDGRRKLSCMAAVHRREGSQHAHMPQLMEPAASSPGVELRKAEAITLMLSRAITTEHWVFCSLGSAHFLEYVLRNPFTTAHTVTISSDQPELSVITNPEEWQYFRSLKSDSSPVERNMFHLQPGAVGPQVYLRPLENLHIPFKYQSFECDHNCSTHGPSVAPAGGGSQLVQRNRAHVAVSRTIKVTFSTEDSKPLSILQLNIQVTPPTVDQSFRLYHPEQSFLKKAIRLPTWDPPPGGNLEVTVRCSDRDVVCQSWKMMPGEPQDVYVKVPGSPSPHVRMFFILVYTDRWKAAPSQVWQVYVHFLERVDISAVSGQRSCRSLVLRGKHSTRKLRCFSSHPQDLEVDPGDVFALPPAAVQEVQVSVQPWRAGRRFFYLSAVDVEQHRLVSSWLLCLTVHQPIISKAFELCMPVGEGRGSSRKISYTNPYSGPRTLLLRSDQPHLLQFKEERFQVGGGETYTIGLRFAPSQRPGAVEILVFVNDLQEKTEEAFCVKALYS